MSTEKPSETLSATLDRLGQYPTPSLLAIRSCASSARQLERELAAASQRAEHAQKDAARLRAALEDVLIWARVGNWDKYERRPWVIEARAALADCPDHTTAQASGEGK